MLILNERLKYRLTKALLVTSDIYQRLTITSVQEIQRNSFSKGAADLEFHNKVSVQQNEVFENLEDRI